MERVRAVITDEGPGIESTSRLFKRASRTILYPGSEIRGVPASETRAKFLPDFRFSRTAST